MLLNFFSLMATFVSPEQIGTDPKSILWFIPLSAAIAIVYKATKLEKITPGNFAKEVILLFGSIAVFMVITGVVLFAVTWLILK